VSKDWSVLQPELVQADLACKPAGPCLHMVALPLAPSPLICYSAQELPALTRFLA